MKYIECSVEVSDKIVVLEECRSKFTINNVNRKSLKKVKVDGCLLPPHVEKCDWIVEDAKSGGEKIAYFVELKGCDIKKAADQIVNTLLLTNEIYAQYKKHCFIVASRVPRHDTELFRQKKEMRSRYKASLSIKSIRGEQTI